MIGSVSFDGASEALWTNIAPHVSDFFESIGVAPEHALEAAFFFGLVAATLIILGFYWLGAVACSVGAASARVAWRTSSSIRSFRSHWHTWPRTYLTLLLIQGQSIVFLDPYPKRRAGRPARRRLVDLFGTDVTNFNVISSNDLVLQVAFVVAGHVALTLAHDRALALYDRAKLAVRSQYWMLGVMIGFTSLALWLLSQANA